ncbi:hypothetical protein BIW11_07996, partial [Tropilaelaps mercedesae]
HGSIYTIIYLNKVLHISNRYGLTSVSLSICCFSGAISRLRRQSPLQFIRQHSSISFQQRQAIHAEAFESSAELARDLSKALHQAINSLTATETVSLPKSTEHSVGNGSAVSSNPFEEHHHNQWALSNGFTQATGSNSHSSESSASSARKVYHVSTFRDDHCRLETSETIPVVAAVVEPTVQIAAVRAIKNDAPDLVQDLPPTATSGGSSGGEEDDAPSPQPSSMGVPVSGAHCSGSVKEVSPASNNLAITESRLQNLSTAERFAMSNQCTIRKGSPRPTPRNAERALSSGSSTPFAPSNSPQQGVLSGGPEDPFASASYGTLRRSSIGSVSPVLSLASTTTASPSVQKLKRMFSEPDQRGPAPPLSPKPALKAKPVTLLKLGRRSNPIVAPRASPPDVEQNEKAEKPNVQSRKTTADKDAFQGTTPSNQIREYKQTSC